MSVYYADQDVTLHHGDAHKVLAAMPDASVDCIVTSPPYYGLRDYGHEGQAGAEETPAEYVTWMAALFREARRVLADDGTLWVNLGDSYQSTGGNEGVGKNAKVGSTIRQATGRTRPKSNLPQKNMIGIPWRVAFALQDDGWILRNDIAWHKTNAMPFSGRDRFASRHEHIFMFTKSRRYHFDLDAVRVDTVDGSAKKNPGDVWSIPTKPFKGAHFAVFPPELPRRCILAGCKPGGSVLDPFHGSGTTGMVAQELGRTYVGVDLNADYLDLSLRTRLHAPSLPDWRNDVTQARVA